MDSALEEFASLTNNDSYLNILRLLNDSMYGNSTPPCRFIDLVRTVQHDKDFYIHASYSIRNIILYLSPILLILGLVGNILSFIVLYAYSRQYQAYHLLYVLSIMDIILLLSGLFRLWIKELIALDIADISRYSCKILVFSGFFSSHCSVWIVSFISIERAISVLYPLQTMQLINGRRNKIVVTILVAFCGLLDFHLFFTIDVSANTCGPLQETKMFIENIWAWIDTFIYSCIPFFVIVVSNIITVVSLFIARRRRNGMAVFLPKKDLQTLTKEHVMTIMLLSLTFSFFVMLTPINIMTILVGFWNQSYHSLKDTAIFELANVIVEMLMYSHHAFNFLLYFWTGSEFRRQFKKKFCRKKVQFSMLKNSPSLTMIRHSSTQLTVQDCELSNFCSNNLLVRGSLDSN